MYFYNASSWYSILVVHILLLCENYIYCLCTQAVNDVIRESHFAFHHTIFGTFQLCVTQVLTVLSHSLLPHTKIEDG